MVLRHHDLLAWKSSKQNALHTNGEKQLGYFGQHKVYIWSGTRWQATFLGFALSPDWQWCFEASHLQKAYTHTDQCLNFKSHHPVEHKLSVVRTLLQRSHTLVTDSQEHDKLQEDSHVEEALCASGYPQWSFREVKHQLKSRTTTKNNRKKHQEDSSKGPVIVTPYV